jgi:hypothetical protein
MKKDNNVVISFNEYTFVYENIDLQRLKSYKSFLVDSLRHKKNDLLYQKRMYEDIVIEESKIQEMESNKNFDILAISDQLRIGYWNVF